MKSIRFSRIVGLVALGLVVLLAPTRVQLELGMFIVMLFVWSRLLRRASLNAEAWKLFFGPFIYLPAFALGQYFSSSGIGPGLIPMLVPTAFLCFGLSWSLIALHRLGEPGWIRRRWRFWIPAAIVILLVMIEAHPTAAAAAVLLLALLGIPGDWIQRLAWTGRWKPFVFLLLFPIAFAFIARIETNAGEVSLITEDTEAQAGLIGASRALLLIYWLTIPLRIILGGVRHLIAGMSIRLRLLLNYFFNTVVPGVLTLALVAVAVFAGVGTLKARAVRNLIYNDLRTLAAALREGRTQGFAEVDSLGEAIYLRIPTAEDEFGRAALGSLADEVLHQGTVPGTETVLSHHLGNRQVGPVDLSWIEEAVSDSAPVHELWAKVAGRACWALPDTIVPPSEWVNAETTVAGLVPIGSGKAAFVAAEPARRHALLRQVYLRPFNRTVLTGYKGIIGSDLVVNPTQTLHVMAGEDEEPEADGIELSDYWEDVSSLTTMPPEQTQRGFLHRPLHHGVCELQTRPEETGPGGRIRGLIVVRTSIAELASAFYTTRGMNMVVVVIIIVLGSMILVAVMFSSILGFSLNMTITSSVAALKRGAERIRKGDLDARIDLSTRGELGRLAESFNQMAADIKVLIEKVAEKERLDRELQIAREIQVKLLPADLPQVKGFDLAATSRPAREVGGDYYDALLLEPGRLVLVVADVSGKGVAAAMLMSNLQAALHALLHQNLPLDDMVGRLNEVVYKNSTSEMFITFFIAIIDTSSMFLEYVNAGHEQPFLIRQDETIELGPCGLILGAMSEAPYRLGTIMLRAGDMLALYSDGITEAMNADEEEFDKERLTAALTELQNESAADVLRGVLDRVQTHCGAESMPRDDLTFLVARMVVDRDN